ncbi:Coatomer subunit gamma-2 [Acropora cervicornis]|uniref:Coatomer subunit gamma n=1 Tax=Acropora cervicornis TaxID=6130 RepID=A0AAD9Q3Z9_ACRCE|nr:Coatomer subunit gamma-2 [Acropora cervicornis]
MQYLRRDKKDEEDGPQSNPFQNLDKSAALQEVMLRRMVYLAIKELANIAEDVIIVTSSLTKDMTGKEDMYRASAIRALCKITDSTMLQGIERYLKQAIVDKNASVSSAALVSALHLMKPNYDVVKRWVNEAQEAVSNDNTMVQYHALGLLYHVKKTDRLAVSKLIFKYTKQSLRSPYAVCMLIRIASNYLDEEPEVAESPLYDFLESCLRHKSEMVIYEAARALVNLKNLKSRDLCPAISVLQLFLSSPRPTLRFAAVRTLNKVAMAQPMSVTTCNLDLENLITDTGNESSVDRLMKQISSFMSEISDEFKIVVVEAIRSLCLKFPRKHHVMMNFLSSMLRDEGGFDYKKAIVDTIIVIIEENSEAKEAGLGHLCEFIEDCEHTVLATRILHLLGREGPRSQNPSKYIRFIYNRVILENAAVRAAAVTSLAKFGAHCDSLCSSILVLLSRCLLDTDDEVRDRATFYRALYAYVKDASHSAPFDLKTVPLATTPMQDQVVKPGKPAIETPSVPTKAAAPVAATRQDVYAEQLAAIPQFATLGPLFRSSPKPVELTESETEYVVNCVKHVFNDHIVFQFDCTNTLNDQILENVKVEMEPSEEDFEVVCYVPRSSLAYNAPGTTYTLVKLPDDASSVKDCDPNTGEPDDEGYEDEYVLEDVDVLVADHVSRVHKTNFLASWEEIGDEFEMQDTYALTQMSSLEEAVKQIIDYLGMQPCERSDRVNPDKNSHALLLAGVFRGGHDVLVRTRLAFDQGVTMNITVRSDDAGVSEVILSAVG